MKKILIRAAIAVSAAALAHAAYAAGTTPSSLAGKTCRGEYHYDWGHNESNMGALMFRPDASGRATLFMWLGRQGREQYKTAPESKYRNMGGIQLTPTSAGMGFIHPISKKLYEFTSKGSGAFKLTLHQNDGSTSSGVLECN